MWYTSPCTRKEKDMFFGPHLHLGNSIEGDGFFDAIVPAQELLQIGT